MALAPGDTFGRYTIVELVGMGGMGQVLLAVDNVLERHVALKIIRPDRVASEEALARFFREARLAARLTHANTLQIYDLGTVEGMPFIAMEHIEGKALSAYCGRVDIAIERKLGWMLDAARGLGAAHRHGLVHRDVKPANIMVTDDDHVKVVDFGLAKRTSTSSKRFTAALGKRKTFQTELGFVLGTPAYMAPEQIDGAEVDARADQFSWALTAYTLLTGKNPRVADPMLCVFVPLDQAMKGVSRKVAAVLQKALAEDPSARYADMQHAVTALERVLAAPPSTRDVPSPVVQLAQNMRPPTRPNATMEPPAPQPSGRRSWRFERSEGACAEGPFHVATFSADGRQIAAFGREGMATYQGKWRSHPLPPGLRAADVRCARFSINDESVIVGGARGLAARVFPNGNSERWHPPKREAFVLDGVEVTPQGWTTFVGRTDSGGVIARLGENGLDLTWASSPLRAVVTLATGTVLACGPRGALVTVTGSIVSELTRVTGEDLLAIARLGTGAVAVGANGVAVRIDASFRCTLENVRTTSSLAALNTTEVDAWAASDVGRIMKRDRTGVWRRMAPGWGAEPRVLAIWAKGVRVRAVCHDASRIGGWLRE